MVPVFGVYRCHNCNWRGWLRRSNATPLRIGLVIGVYALVAASIVVATVYAIHVLWPTPQYKYTP